MKLKRSRVRNPYVGPRAFDRDDPIYGREADAQRLCDLLISERIVVLHAPSGAGKTSLVQAAAVPIMVGEGFTVSAPLRVNTPPSDDRVNPYTYSTNLGLLGDRVDEWGPELAYAPLGQVLDRIDEAEASAGRPPDRVLFFDQFEEIVVLNTADYDRRGEFFAQLARALNNQRRWALFAIREDYLGRLDAFRPRMPTHLRATMRLDFLERAAARRAMIEPARAAGVEFTEAAADEIFGRLAVIQADIGGRTEEVPSHNVEPVQLQVICHQLWGTMQPTSKGDRARIDKPDVERLNFDTYLAAFYADTVRDVVAETGADELSLRTWFDKELITPDGWRRQTRTAPRFAAADGDAVLTSLEAHYLIRSDLRGGSFWYELAHDRMLRPVREDNERWFATYLPPVRRDADAWILSGRDRSFLIKNPRELNAAKHWLEADEHAATAETQEFLRESEAALKEIGRLRRVTAMAGFAAYVALAEFLVIVFLLVRHVM